MATQKQSLTVKLAHAEIRIAELEADLAASDGTYITMVVALAELERLVEVHKTEAHNLRLKGRTPARIAYLAREKSNLPTPFQLACAAAKAAAMAGGKIIRVAA